MRLLSLFTVLCALHSPTVRAESQPDLIKVLHSPNGRTTTVLIRAPGGNATWSDVLRGIARAKGLNDKALQGILPRGSFRLDGWAAALTFAGINAALSPMVTVHTQGGLTLRVTLDRKALLATARRLKKRIQGALLSRVRGTPQSYGLSLDQDWYTRKKRLVLFVHGFHASPETSTFKTLRRVAREKGHGTAVVKYPNDQPIAESANQLSLDLKKIGVAHPKKPITLVAKSMGGLVARATLEKASLDPLNVDQLIMIATPNQGSVLAHFGFALEVWEHVVERNQSTVEAFYASVEDGLGDAADDLVPGSQFLRTLNANGRNPRVACSILLGNQAYLTLAQREAVRALVSKGARDNRFLRLLGPELDTHLSQMDEVIKGRGDGAVAIERGKLPGCDDVEILPFDHVGGSEQSEPLRSAVLRRLKP